MIKGKQTFYLNNFSPLHKRMKTCLFFSPPMINFIQYDFCLWSAFWPPSQFLHPRRTSQINTVRQRKEESITVKDCSPNETFESAHQVCVFTHSGSTNSESKARISPTHHCIFTEHHQAINSTCCAGRLSYAPLHSKNSCTAPRIDWQYRILLILADLNDVDLKMCSARWRLMVRNLDRFDY